VPTTSLGRLVTVCFRAAPAGQPFTTLSQSDTSLRLRPLQPRGPLPFGGERVSCESTVGQWSTNVVSSEGGVLELAAPDWVSRSSTRRWRRTPLDEPVGVRAGAGTWAGRLQDVSMQGAAVLVERAAGLRQGDSVIIDVGGGAIRATVRSVRPHPQRLLVVVGVSYERLEPAALRFVAAAVYGRASGQERVRR